MICSQTGIRYPSPVAGCFGPEGGSLRLLQPQFASQLSTKRWDGSRLSELQSGKRRFGVRCRIIGESAPMGKVSQYEDAWWERLVIRYMVSKMSETSGETTDEKGYDAFVDISKRIVRGRSPLEQRFIVTSVLEASVPPFVFKLARMLFSMVSRKLACEYYALSTSIFFQWLVGPAETIEREVDGVQQWSGVKIKKCRFLESSNCVGMCVNLCKVPSQEFISSSFGVPLYMKPNFEDMSCEMLYGEHPPPEGEDPAGNQPCYATLCTTAQQRAVHCAKTLPTAQTALR